jgi:hypothetical protein
LYSWQNEAKMLNHFNSVKFAMTKKAPQFAALSSPSLLSQAPLWSSRHGEAASMRR